MNPQREFIKDTLHALAQPITALQVTLELGLRKPLDEQASHQVLEDCLLLSGRLMQDLALFREIAILDEAPALESCDGHTLLQSCVEEMTIVAQASGIALQHAWEIAAIQCNVAMFERAIFVLLDQTIATTPRGAEISISLRKTEDGVLLEVRPGTPQGARQKLCHKLLQFAGGGGIGSAPAHTLVTFRASSGRPLPLTL